MTLPSLLRDYAVFNLWANRRIADWLLAKPDELLTRETPSSFPTLRATLQHIWGAQDVWLNRLRGDSPEGFEVDKFTGSNAEVIENLLRSAQDFADFVAAADDDFFEKTTSYTHFSGKHYTQNNSEILLHVLQHSTFHRGQIVTMGRSLGLTDPPPTDYIAYVRLKP